MGFNNENTQNLILKPEVVYFWKSLSFLNEELMCFFNIKSLLVSHSMLLILKLTQYILLFSCYQEI